MLGGAFVVLGLLAAYAAGQLIITDAKCLMGYECTFNTLNQSPCDVGASLAAVCAPNGRFNLNPLPSGYVYSGPHTEDATSCRCSSVYYSMLSACGYCQGRNFLHWSSYSTNCSKVFVSTYDQMLPSGVKVPAWAYLNVLNGDNFNVTLAQLTRGTESSRLSLTQSSTTSSLTWSALPATSTSTTWSSLSATLSGGGRRRKSRTKVGAVAGGIAGGVILIITIALVVFLWLRRKRSSSTTPADVVSPFLAPRSIATFPSPFLSTTGLDNGGLLDPLIWPSQSPFAPSMTTHFTGSSGQQTVHAQQMISEMQSDIHPAQHSMIPPQNTNMMLPRHNINTVAPTQYMILNPQKLWHQTRSEQSMLSALPRQNWTASRQNLTQSVISALPEQSSESMQNVEPMPPWQNTRQDTMHSAQDILWSPPEYTVEPF